MHPHLRYAPPLALSSLAAVILIGATPAQAASSVTPEQHFPAGYLESTASGYQSEPAPEEGAMPRPAAHADHPGNGMIKTLAPVAAPGATNTKNKKKTSH
ncbi:hypothetical protein OR16_37665 [Cupriavidus basilensis OR16]|uniref:Uncharacterized protein n=1 Tax=Cupriavidus basilensis OR16 TaxID=1127483 RepID=H1SGK6_9BURK|nr:hypothetical protein [Cupriavidus basilensis]EHP38332.1 hypothetical protein OR16_37665 [Cupriavidus basilensis OR16]